MKPHLILLWAVVISSTQVACNEASTTAPLEGSQQSSAIENKVPVGTPLQAILNRASQYWVNKDLDKAETEFRKAVKGYPESALAYTRLAGFLLSQNKTSEAIPIYQEAIILDPENPKLFAALSIAYLHQQKFNMAKVMVDQALKLNPDMKQAKKLDEYIAIKERVIAKASTSKSTTNRPDPNDGIHSITEPLHDKTE